MSYRLLAQILVAVALFACHGCGRDKDVIVRKPAEGGKLIFAVTLGGAPYSYADPITGEPIGIDIDIARATAKKLALPLEVREMEFSELLPKVKTGEVDFAGAAITITPSRALDVDFSDSYAADGSAFISRADQPPMSIPRAFASRVGTQSGSFSLFYLCEHWVDPVGYPTYEDALVDFESGKLDAVFYDAEPIRHTVAASNGKYVISPLETREHYGIAVRKDFLELLEAVDAVIAERKGGK